MWLGLKSRCDEKGRRSEGRRRGAQGAAISESPACHAAEQPRLCGKAAGATCARAGPGVAPGVNRRIVWNAGYDWNNQYVPNGRVRVTAYDGTTPVPPSGMVYIPTGVSQMGDSLDNDTSAMPLHNVTLNNFFMDRFEVARELLESLKTWGAGHGYSIGGGS